MEAFELTGPCVSSLSRRENGQFEIWATPWMRIVKGSRLCFFGQ